MSLSPDEVLEAVEQRGVNLGRGALSWYVTKGLIPRPEVRGLGRGRGSSSEYPPETVAELLVANMLLGKTILFVSEWTPMSASMVGHDMTDLLRKRITTDDVAEARRRFYDTPPHGRSSLVNISKPAPSPEQAWKDELLLGWAALRDIELEKARYAGD